MRARGAGGATWSGKDKQILNRVIKGLLVLQQWLRALVFVLRGVFCGWQGEDQKKLDIVSNEVFCNALRNSGKTGVIASEEEDFPVAVEETYSGKKQLFRQG